MKDKDISSKELGRTTGNNITIPIDKLGAPGAVASLIVVPLYAYSEGELPAPKLTPDVPHDFEVKARLSRSPSVINFKGDFGPDDGSSYLIAPEEVSSFEVAGTHGTMHLSRNLDNELSVALAKIRTVNVGEAHIIFAKMFSAFADHVSYLGSVPVVLDMIIVRDLASEVQTIYYVSPPRPTNIKNGLAVLHSELMPVYALYREAQNSSSPYYRILCHYKIMEGLLGTYRTGLRKRAQQEGVEIKPSKSIVPDHEDISENLRIFIGKPIKHFFDNVLQKQFRDLMAHFNLRGRSPLNVSDQAYWNGFMEMAFLTDLCIRVLIDQHEQALVILESKAMLPGLPGA